MEHFVSPISHIEFTIFGNEEIKKLSVMGKNTSGIDASDLYDNLEAKVNGLLDPRMGTIEDHVLCATCGLNKDECCGHFGHIVLEDYVFHFGYLAFVRKILSCVCIKCSKLLVYKNEHELSEIIKNKTGKARLASVMSLVKDITHCQKENGCGTPKPKIRIDIPKEKGYIRLVAQTDLSGISPEDGGDDKGKKKIEQVLTPEDCYNILKNISDNDCLVLGLNPKFCRPEMMIHKIFPVPPVQIRPSARTDGTSMMREDDLTSKLVDILKANIRLANAHMAVSKSRDSAGNIGSKNLTDHQLLQYHVIVYFDNESPAIPRSEQKGRPTKSLSARLTGKEGRFRSNLEGKRVEYSARTVISPDPSIRVDQVGIPLRVAMNLTFPEIVSQYNINYLTSLVRHGRYQYPGANFVFTKKQGDGKFGMVDLRYRKEKVELNYGDIVERHLINGDIALLNRQPTLHKQSMMAHYIHVLNNPNLGNFRVSVGVTTPYNADFDGDEMNITVPRDIQTKTELEEIATVRKQLVSALSSKAIYGGKLDCLVGTFNLTRTTDKIGWKHAMNMLAYTSITDYDTIKKGTEHTGHEIFSAILPEKLNLSDDAKLPVIKDGNLISGSIAKATVGHEGSNNIVRITLDEYDDVVARDLMDDILKLADNFNLYNGFTVGIGDMIFNPDIKKQIEHILDTKKLKAQQLITEIENDPTISSKDKFEMYIFQTLDVTREDVSKILISNITPDNALGIMMLSGAKGDASNIGQMAGCLAQQALEGKRLPKKCFNRSLPYFPRHLDTAEARGFIGSNFVKGLDLSEFIFHNMSSREGIIDSAIKTAESGYIERKLAKTMEDVKVVYDCTVRTANNGIVQFIYGDTGTDTTKQYLFNIKMLEFGDKKMTEIFKFTDKELKDLSNYSLEDNETYLKMLIEMRDQLRITQQKAKVEYLSFSTNFMLPINLNHIVEVAKGTKIKNPQKLDPKYVEEQLNAIIEHKNTQVTCMKFDQSVIKKLDETNAKYTLNVALHYIMAPKRCILEYKLSKQSFDEAINDIIQSYNKNMAEPGLMVGIIAGQTVSQPVTQMTLNTFHHTGIGSMGTATLGVPRMRELYGLSRNIKTPHMNLYLDKEHQGNKETASKIAAHIKYTTIENIRKRIDVYYDPFPRKAGGFMDKDNVKNIFYSHTSKNGCQQNIEYLPWLMRIELDREQLLLKEVTLLDIKSKFCNMWEKRFTSIKSKEHKQLLEKIVQCAILSNTDNDELPVIHLRFDMVDFKTATIVDFIDNIVDKFKLKGFEEIPGISGVYEKPFVVFNGDDHAMENKNDFIICTDGTNLYDIRYIAGLDIAKTMCNDVVAIYETYGIEAARNALLNEIVTTFSASGNTVNYHHLSLLVDFMTRDGIMISIDRHGMSKTDTSPFARASFEKTVDQLITAAVFNETDTMKGVSSRIMAGHIIHGGTGLCELIMDSDMIEKSEYTGDFGTENTSYKKTHVEIAENVVINDIIDREQQDIFVPE